MNGALSQTVASSITINTNLGPLEIDALSYGALACHKGVGPYKGRWVVTHIPTGFAMSSKGTFGNEKAAVAAMEEIAGKGDWTDMSKPNRRKLGKMVAAVFAKHGAEMEA